MKLPMLRYFAYLCLLSTASNVRAELLVHYTFDDADISGSTVLDIAGASNNATIVNNVSTGIAGVLGEAIRLPNDDGASYVRLPASSNPAPNGSSARTIAYWFSQEAVGVENKMFGYGSGANGTSFDVSLEGGGIRLRYSGGNVTWGSGFDFAGADAGFHHLAIRVPSGAFDYLDVDVLLDGQPLVGVPTGGNPAGTAINTGGGGATNLDIGRSPVFSPAGDYIGLIDDFRIYDTALSDSEILELATAIESLVLQVDPVTGQGAIRNLTDAPISLDYYELNSSMASLSPGSWNSLEGQDRANFPSGSGNGDGWEELGVGTSSKVAEGWLLDISTLEPGEWIDLGTVYNPAMPQQLGFVYNDGQSFRNGQVQFVSAGLSADFDRDGAVDADDLSRWQSSFSSNGAADANGDGFSGGVDLLTWQRQFGSSIPVANSQTVPEPSTLIFFIFGCMLILRGSQRPCMNLI